MLRTALWTLRQRRYQALALAMLFVAAGCIAAGTWQIYRFNQSVHDNDALDANARAATVSLDPALVPLTSAAEPVAAPGRDAIRFRSVTIEGNYLAQGAQYLRNQSDNGADGYYVVAPFRTADGVLLVLRGFVPATGAQLAPPATVPSPPGGTVRLNGRLETISTASDDGTSLTQREIATLNPQEQSARLGTPVYQAALALSAGAPGSAALAALPDPDLSNPAGGAYEWQHLAYIIQWYLFALLALAAPFVMGRSEAREAQRRFLGVDTGAAEFGLDATPPARALPPGEVDRPDGALVRRAPGSVARAEQRSPQWQRAERLADRYGRSLGPAHRLPADPGRLRPETEVVTTPVADSARAAHRSEGDGYHGSYNDYLWQLALADGNVLTPEEPTGPRRDPSEPDGATGSPGPD